MLQAFFRHQNPVIPPAFCPRREEGERNLRDFGIFSYSDITIVISGLYNSERDMHKSTDNRAWALIAIRTSFPPTFCTTNNPTTGLKAGMKELCSSLWHAHFDFTSVTLRRMHSNTFFLWIREANRPCRSKSEYRIPSVHWAPLAERNSDSITYPLTTSEVTVFPVSNEALRRHPMFHHKFDWLKNSTQCPHKCPNASSHTQFWLPFSLDDMQHGEPPSNPFNPQEASPFQQSSLLSGSGCCNPVCWDRYKPASCPCTIWEQRWTSKSLWVVW